LVLRQDHTPQGGIIIGSLDLNTLKPPNLAASIFYGGSMKRVAILIDGQNLYYNLQNIGLIEKNIKWNDLFHSWIVGGEDELTRTYWFRPQKILDSYFTSENIRSNIVFKDYRIHHPNYKDNKANIPADIIAEIERKATIAEDWLKQEKTKFSKIEYNYDQLCFEHGDIEFVKTGIVKVNPYIQEYIGEKGVDISLAVKMISLSVDNRVDKIILVSGDFDYSEAIKFVKNRMTKIHLVKIHKGYPPQNRSVSRDLAVLADRVIDVYESDVRSKYLK